MVKFASRRVGAVVAIAIAALALTACGSDSPDPGASDGTGVIGDPSAGASASDAASPSTSATDSSSGGSTSGSTGGSNAGPSYPGTAKDYGLEILKAIDGPDTARIVDLSSLQVATTATNADHHWSDKDAHWTFVSCSTDSTQVCKYFNNDGNIATVSIEKSKLGKKEAVTYVDIFGDVFPTYVNDYVGGFVYAWQNGDYAAMVSRSSNSIADYFLNLPSVPSVGYFGSTYSCQSGKTCIDAASELAGGGPYGTIYHFIIDQSKINQGKSGGITGYLAPDNTWH